MTGGVKQKEAMGLLADMSRKGAPARRLSDKENAFTADFRDLLMRWVAEIHCCFVQQEIGHVMAESAEGAVDFNEIRLALEYVEQHLYIFSDDDHWNTDAICELFSYTYRMTFHGNRNPFPRPDQPFVMPTYSITVG